MTHSADAPLDHGRLIGGAAMRTWTFIVLVGLIAISTWRLALAGTVKRIGRQCRRSDDQDHAIIIPIALERGPPSPTA